MDDSHERQSPKIGSRALAKTLDEYFGLTKLREGQESVIRSILAGRNTLAIMPTGAGKSLCYQLPGILMPGLTVVVSPLISLMKDQAEKLSAGGHEAAQLHSAIKASDEAEAIRDIEQEQGEFIFATPERLADPEFLSSLKQSRVSLFVIDEAHCISQWGHDFRPAYLELHRIVQELDSPPVLALTATATEDVVEDIQRLISPEGMEVVRTGLYRPNLHFSVLPVTNEDERLSRVRELVREGQGSGIVYVATVKAAELVHEALLADGASVALYHGRLSSGDRARNQEAFMEGTKQVMVATNAFGMGIDKPDIRFVLHYQMPGSIEAYYQESGRAGRDGEMAQCTLLYHLDDRRVHQFFLGGRYPEREHLMAVYAALNRFESEGTPPTLKRLEEALQGEVAKSKVQVALRLLKNQEIIGEGSHDRCRVLRKGLKQEELAQYLEAYRKRSERDRKMLDKMIFYSQSAMCRWKLILHYFGGTVSWEHCGSCDNCISPPTVEPVPADAHPVARLASKKSPSPPISVGGMARVPKYGVGEVMEVEGDVVSIRFPDGENKQFLSRYVRPSR